MKALIVLMILSFMIPITYVKVKAVSHASNFGFTFADNWTLVVKMSSDKLVSAKDGSLTTGDLNFWAGIYKKYNSVSDTLYIAAVVYAKAKPRDPVFDHTFRTKQVKLVITNQVGNQLSKEKHVPFAEDTGSIIVEYNPIDVSQYGHVTYNPTLEEIYEDQVVTVNSFSNYDKNISTVFSFVHSKNTTANRKEMILLSSQMYLINNFSTCQDNCSIGFNTEATAYFFRDGFWNDNTSSTTISNDFSVNLK